MSSIVCKFGGTSLADAPHAKKVWDIIKSNKERRYIVVSAPGKRHKDDTKVTDLFINWHDRAAIKSPAIDVPRKMIEDRYLEIIRGLGLSLDLSHEFSSIARGMEKGASLDYAKSRGEYLMGKVMAKLLGYDFLDPTTCIRIEKNGLPNFLLTNSMLKEWTGRVRGACVMPGFYGLSMEEKPAIKTFSRGGSDISGAILAGAVAGLYENWTDVEGMLAADPAIIENPRLIQKLTYREARELAYAGFVVMHEEALYPAQRAGIPTHIRNTNYPDGMGTQIVSDNIDHSAKGEIVGIASRRNFAAFDIEKPLMNSEHDFGLKVLQVLARYGISYEHSPSGIDEMSVVINKHQLVGKDISGIKDEIKCVCQTDDVSFDPDIALLTIVGNGMVHQDGVAARFFAAIHRAKVSNRLITQPLSERNITVGVATGNLEAATRAVYEEFFN